MNANELADELDYCYGKEYPCPVSKEAATMLRQQQAEIENLKNANRFIQNFAEEQHQRAVALEMRELTDEEIYKIANSIETIQPQHGLRLSNDLNVMDFARAILRKANEK